MAKPLKVDHAVCPKCAFRKPLDENGCYERHLIYGDKLPSGENVNSVCEGSGLKPSRMALRMERKRIRDLEAINRRHEERQKLQKELQPVADSLLAGWSINGEQFGKLLKAYGLWDTIPPRRKNTIKDHLRCLRYDGTEINLILHGKRSGCGIMPLAEQLLTALARSIL